MKGRKPNAQAAEVVLAGPWAMAEAVSPPDWLMIFEATEWGARRAVIAGERFAVLISSLRRKGTFDGDNAVLVEIAAAAYADWRLAEAHVAKNGPIVPAPRTHVPMHNPYKAIADAAFKRILQAEAALGIPPVERGRATPAPRAQRAANAADAYLARSKTSG